MKLLNLIRVDQSAPPFLRRQNGQAILVKLIAALGFSGAAARVISWLMGLAKNPSGSFESEKYDFIRVNKIDPANKFPAFYLVANPFKSLIRSNSDYFEKRLASNILHAVYGQNLNLIGTFPAHFSPQALIVPLADVTVKNISGRAIQRFFEKAKNAVVAFSGTFLKFHTSYLNLREIKRFLNVFKGDFSAITPFPAPSNFPIFRFFIQGGIYA